MRIEEYISIHDSQSLIDNDFDVRISDGGDWELVDLKGNVVYARFTKEGILEFPKPPCKADKSDHWMFARRRREAYWQVSNYLRFMFPEFHTTHVWKVPRFWFLKPSLDYNHRYAYGTIQEKLRRFRAFRCKVNEQHNGLVEMRMDLLNMKALDNTKEERIPTKRVKKIPPRSVW